MNTPIICAGFHRSGTSLASQMLHLSGIPFAIENMAGDISNPDGHFEDVIGMHMHDEFLAESGSNWRFHGECEINHDPSVIERLKKYCSCRDKLDGSLWLMKDPRATLYLNDWQDALKGKGKFVLLYRHWGLCIQSLLKRHSMDVVYGLPTGKALSENLVFWKNPELAARMWLAYNKAMITFIKSNNDNCILVSQSALMQGYDLIEGINNKFECQLKPLITSPVKPEYASENIDASILMELPVLLQSELNDTFQQLAQLCDTPNSGDVPEFIEKPRDNTAISLILESMKLSVSQANKEYKSEKNLALPQFKDPYIDYQKLPFDELLLKLQELKPLADYKISKFALPLTLRLIELEPFKVAGHEWAGRVSASLGQHKIAEMYFVKAIAIETAPSYIRMLLADTYFSRYDFETAEYFYRVAFKSNKNNPLFSVKLGDLYFTLKEYDKSIINYERALALSDNDWTRSKLINVIDEYTGTQSAIDYINSSLTKQSSSFIKKKLITLKLKVRMNDAKSSYRIMVKEGVTRKKINTCFEALAPIGISSVQLQQLAYWFSVNMLDLFSVSEFNELFVPKVELIDFIVCGAQKSGTTALYNIFCEQTNVDMSFKKEVHYFDSDRCIFDLGYRDYHSCFPALKAGKLRGEITPIYMYWKHSLDKISKYNPDIKIIVILRNPIDRAYSHWNMERSRGNVKGSFSDALILEEEVMRNGDQHRVHSYIDRGFYSDQINKLRSIFPDNNLLFIKYDEFVNNQRMSFRNICRFLGLPLLSNPDVVGDVFSGSYDSEMNSIDRAKLEGLFKNEINELEFLLKWKLDDWLPGTKFEKPDNQLKKILFYRDLQVFQGGHLKVFDYFNHLKFSKNFIPEICFSDETDFKVLGLWDQEEIRETNFSPENSDILFVAGTDWHKLELTSHDKPVVNLIQGFRHVDESHDIYKYLKNKAIRICVSKEVKIALENTGIVNGPIYCIENGIDLTSIPKRVDVPLFDFAIMGQKNPKMAKEIEALLLQEGAVVSIIVESVKREEFLKNMALSQNVILLPQFKEGFYLPAVEAMAMGHIPIVPDCVGNRGFCKNGYNAFMPEFTTKAIYEVAKKLFGGENGDMVGMKVNAIETAKSHNLNKEREEFLSLMEDVERIWEGEF